ncbi:MAG TPA: biotin/lipoyl-binding protein, partial [Candidatus Xenobia bacterium]
MKRWLILALLLTGCHGGHPEPEASSSAMPSVTVSTVHYGSIEQLVPVTGTLVPPRDRQATISPPVAGVLARLDIHLGQHVRRGQVIAQLNTAAVEGQIRQARAALS